jgi:scavenger receptor class B, member 1
MWLTFGLFTTWKPLFEIVLNERLRMSPLYPSYFWWKDPEPEVLLKVFVFNITNSADFIAGRDSKLKLQEIGPITFQEILEHTDVVIHEENSTLSYTVGRRIVFKESANIKDILNQTVFVANMAALSGCTYVAKDNVFKRMGYNALLNFYSTQPVIETTIYNYFFNLTDPILLAVKSILPHMVPQTNSGILKNVSTSDRRFGFFQSKFEYSE